MRDDPGTANRRSAPVRNLARVLGTPQHPGEVTDGSLLTEVCARDRRQGCDDNCSDFATVIDDHKPVLEWRNAGNVGRLSSGAIGIDKVGAADGTAPDAGRLSVRNTFRCEGALAVVRDHRDRDELLDRSWTEAAGASTDQAVVASKCAGAAPSTASVILCGNS